MNRDAKLEHRLAAIMATDVVGYSKLIQTEELWTLLLTRYFDPQPVK